MLYDVSLGCDILLAYLYSPLSKTARTFVFSTYMGRGGGDTNIIPLLCRYLVKAVDMEARQDCGIQTGPDQPAMMQAPVIWKLIIFVFVNANYEFVSAGIEILHVLQGVGESQQLGVTLLQSGVLACAFWYNLIFNFKFLFFLVHCMEVTVT